MHIGKFVQDKYVDSMIRYIEDGDLWRWALPQAKAFYAGLTALNLEYDANKNPEIFDKLLGLTSEQLIASVRVCSILTCCHMQAQGSTAHARSLQYLVAGGVDVHAGT